MEETEGEGKRKGEGEWMERTERDKREAESVNTRYKSRRQARCLNTTTLSAVAPVCVSSSMTVCACVGCHRRRWTPSCPW